MPTRIAAPALELETLVARAARQGWLDPYELLETYVELAPSGHADLAAPRRLDVDALAAALGALPAPFVTAPRVLVVPRLAGFSHEPVAGAPAAGLLPDGTLLLEARFGLTSLLGLTRSLCALAHELDKARTLVPPAQDELFPAENEARVPSGCADTPAPARDLAQIAFAYGIDESALADADAATDGRLLAVLEQSWEIPEIALHAELGAAVLRRRAAARAERIAATLAEMGLATRPLHLWLGSPTVVDCVSPYTRELREAVLVWASAHSDATGGDVELGGTLGEDALYALAADFVAASEGLAEERAEAERTVGIQHYDTDGLGFDIVDVARLDPNLVDARLGAFVAPEPAPVLLRVGLDLEDASGHGIETLVRLLSAHLASVTAALEGTGLDAAPGTVVLPSAALRWAGEQLLALPSTPLGADELTGLAPSVTGGTVLSVPHAALLSATHLAELAHRYQVHGVDVGGAGTLVALAEAAIAGTLPRGCELRWGFVASRYTTSGRPTVTSTAGLSAMAIAGLRRIVAPGKPASPRRSRPSSPGRSVRLKA